MSKEEWLIISSYNFIYGGTFFIITIVIIIFQGPYICYRFSKTMTHCACTRMRGGNKWWHMINNVDNNSYLFSMMTSFEPSLNRSYRNDLWLCIIIAPEVCLFKRCPKQRRIKEALYIDG